MGENFGLGRMNRTAGELVMAADMVEMRVTGDSDEIAFRDQRHPFAQRR